MTEEGRANDRRLGDATWRRSIDHRIDTVELKLDENTVLCQTLADRTAWIPKTLERWDELREFGCKLANWTKALGAIAIALTATYTAYQVFKPLLPH